MKKIININFHSRVVPIEETAYEILQQYIDSLRRYFANEEGRDEIISDIENRFAELFSETLKKGATCITDADVNNIIASMGRPEDFEEEEMPGTANAGTTNQSSGYTGTGTGSTGSQGTTQQQSSETFTAEEPRRLYRADNDKILGGVCAGLANYLKMDPAIVRILFVLIVFAWGTGFLLYIILWAFLPTRSLMPNARKRLYRNPDNRIIAGVSSGLAAYFHIEVWIPRLIFALPMILGVISGIFRHVWFDFDGEVFFTGGFGGTLFITYIVLWIVLPEATSASEKLEMRGEKVDLESIKNTIKNDLSSFSKKAKDMGEEMKGTFQKTGEQVKQGAQNFASEAYPAARRTSSGIGHAIGVLFKAFFLFIAGLIAFSLIMVLIGLAFRGDGILTIKSYILSGFWQNFLAWTSFFLFLVIPVVALLTWLIRRITGVRSRSHYLGYTFATLWVIGLFCFIGLAGMIMNNFRARQHVEEDVKITQPVHGKLIVKAIEGKNDYSDGDWWFDTDWHSNRLFSNLSDDSLLLNTVRVNLLKSTDSDYHVQLVKFSHGNNSQMARDLAGQVRFTVSQTDSLLSLPDGFTILRGQKFRNQQVLVNISIPVGKRILVNSNIDDYNYFNIRVNNRHIRWNRNRDDDWDVNIDGWDAQESNTYSWTSNVEYIMTTEGLSRTDKKNTELEDRNKKEDDGGGEEYKDHSKSERPEQPEKKEKPEPDNGGYRYKRPAAPAHPKTETDTVRIKRTAAISPLSESSTYFLSTMFRL
ncbi:MAG TPA: PspC domain-containing protein [Puia sp.]|nr:PspC domain-containing protein [Puia sp.]